MVYYVKGLADQITFIQSCLPRVGCRC